MMYSDPTGHVRLKLLMGVLMFNNSTGSASASGKLVQTTFKEGDLLSQYAMHTVSPVEAARNLPASASQASTVQRASATAGNGNVNRPSILKGRSGRPAKTGKKLNFSKKVEMETYDQDIGLGWTSKVDETNASFEHGAQGGIDALDDYLYGGAPPLTEQMSTKGDAIRQGWKAQKEQKRKHTTKKPGKPLSVREQANRRSMQ
jgi:hypothetical protein